MIDIEVFKFLLAHVEVKAETKKTPENPEDANLRRLKDKSLFFSSLFVVLFVIVFCAYFSLTNENHTHVGIALNGLIGLSLGLIGYYLRGKS